MKRWRRLDRERLLDCRVFDVERVVYETSAASGPRDYFLVGAPDWINVIPLTDDERVVVIRQFRVGLDAPTLEIPGGMCDPGEDPARAAERELHEETGYAAREIVPLGWVHPNPALQGNRCHTYLARGVWRAGEPAPQGDEEFEVDTVPLSDVPRLIADHVITHALVVAAFYRLAAVGGLRIGS